MVEDESSLQDTHTTETCWLWLQASQKPHEGAWSSFETFVFQQPPMGLTDLTLPQNQLPTHKKRSFLCLSRFFLTHSMTSQPPAHPMSHATGPYTPSQHP